MSKPKIAVVGCGNWGINLIRNFSELGVLSAISDVQSDRALSISKKFKVPALSLTQICQDKGIAGVVIAAPAIQHAKLAELFLKAKKHVFVEKPLALTIEEAEHVCNLAKKEKRVLMVGHLLQYHAAFIKLKKLVKDGKIGRLQYIYSDRLNLGKIRNEENILWSFAPHDISMILGLVGDVPESVYAEGSAHLNSEIADITTTHLRFKNRVRAHIYVSWLHPFKEQKLVVIGDEGMLVFDDGEDWETKLLFYPHEIKWKDGNPLPVKKKAVPIKLKETEPLRSECQHFIDCIKNKNEPCTNGREGLDVLRVLTTAENSMRHKKMLYLDSEKKSKKLKYFHHETAIVDVGAVIGEGTKVWHYSHVYGTARIGQNCILGQNVMIGPEVRVGDNCKVQNNVSLYKGIMLEDGVFCGPSCVFTNVKTPRAEIERKEEFLETIVEKGATIGANATIVCGVRLGAYCFIGAGAVVTKDVKPHALVVGNPAKQIGWVSHSGEKLGEDLICPREKRRYQVNKNNQLEEITRK